MPKCVNGVCLDDLCYCNDGFGGKGCDLPGKYAETANKKGKAVTMAIAGECRILREREDGHENGKMKIGQK